MGFQADLETLLLECYKDSNGQLDITKIKQDASTVYTTACTKLNSLKSFPQAEDQFYLLASEYYLHNRQASIDFGYLIENYITECQFYAYLYIYFRTNLKKNLNPHTLEDI